MQTEVPPNKMLAAQRNKMRAGHPIPLTDDNVHKAVSMLIQHKECAELEYGPVSTWKLSGIRHKLSVKEKAVTQAAIQAEKQAATQAEKQAATQAEKHRCEMESREHVRVDEVNCVLRFLRSTTRAGGLLRVNNADKTDTEFARMSMMSAVDCVRADSKVRAIERARNRMRGSTTERDVRTTAYWERVTRNEQIRADEQVYMLARMERREGMERRGELSAPEQARELEQSRTSTVVWLCANTGVRAKEIQARARKEIKAQHAAEELAARRTAAQEIQARASKEIKAQHAVEELAARCTAAQELAARRAAEELDAVADPAGNMRRVHMYDRREPEGMSRSTRSKARLQKENEKEKKEKHEPVMVQSPFRMPYNPKR
jgi:hypothetical protein